MDACSKSYKYSSSPIYIVMETPEQQLQDQLDAERKIRRNLQKQLQTKEDELEKLKADLRKVYGMRGGKENLWEQVHVSMGVAVFNPQQDHSVIDTVRRADKVMYTNKRIRKNMRNNS